KKRECLETHRPETHDPRPSQPGERRESRRYQRAHGLAAGRKGRGVGGRFTSVLIVENPARTAQYKATMAERRETLATALDAHFPDPAEIVWELGSGHGHFLTGYAHAPPAERCVGIDIMSERVDRALRKKQRARLPNLEFLHTEAALFLEVLPPRIRIKRA